MYQTDSLLREEGNLESSYEKNKNSLDGSELSTPHSQSDSNRNAVGGIADAGPAF